MYQSQFKPVAAHPLVSGLFKVLKVVGFVNCGPTARRKGKRSLLGDAGLAIVKWRSQPG